MSGCAGACTVVLRAGRERSAKRFHPWIYSGAIGEVRGNPGPGGIVKVESAEGETLGLGQWSPLSQIRVRMVAFGEKPEFSCYDAVERAIEARKSLSEKGTTTAMRLINAEADGLPGVTIDRYGDWAVCQFHTPGAVVLKNEIVASIMDILSLKGVYERSDTEVLKREGLEGRNGKLAGDEPPDKIEIEENGLKYLVDVRKGHKTGFYLDQRDNRAIVGANAKGRDVLNVFSYTGGFGLAALKGGAKSVTNIDISAEALALARANAELNGMRLGEGDCIRGNAFEELRKFRDSRRQFDMIILDPPKFAEGKGAVRGAARGYKDINLLAMKLLRPGGMLATFSCSGAVTPEIFGQIVAEAAVDAGRVFTVEKRLGQASDHAETLFFPEGLYLKGLLLNGK